MAEDWDLFAVVKSYASATDTTTAATAPSKPLACLTSLTNFGDNTDTYPFSFPNLKPFSPNPTFSGIFSGSCDHQPLLDPNADTSSGSVSGKSRITQKKLVPAKKQPENQPQLVPAGKTLTFRSIHSRGPKSRKRKNQQNRTVCHLTVENLSADPWSWRKYGQKPIKSSPYPRNYYKCSSSKGCLARKQVEQSDLDPNIFIVTFTGDHTHSIPTHRNSLAGSTRNKLSKAQKPSSIKNPAAEANASCSSPISSTADKGNGEGVEDGESAEEEEISIPDMTIDDDFFNGLQELSGSGGNNGMGAEFDFR